MWMQVRRQGRQPRAKAAASLYSGREHPVRINPRQSPAMTITTI